ncbi:marvel domain-containing protein [Xylariaceae sp. FL0016]|nr:marvel domain-containing protein [Xylariaceae sp. FL0016]
MLSVTAISLRIFLVRILFLKDLFSEVVLTDVKLLVGVIVLSLSVTLAKHQQYGSVPAETGFNGFVGAVAIIASIVGLFSLFMENIKGTLVMGFDFLVALLYLAAGIAYAIALKSVPSCSSNEDYAKAERYENKILNRGCKGSGMSKYCAYGDSPGTDDTSSRCQMARADYVFEFIGFIFVMAMVAFGYVLNRRGGSMTSTRATHV